MGRIIYLFTSASSQHRVHPEPGLTGGTAVCYTVFQNGHDLLIHSNNDLLYNSLIIAFYFLGKFGTLKF